MTIALVQLMHGGAKPSTTNVVAHDAAQYKRRADGLIASSIENGNGGMVVVEVLEDHVAGLVHALTFGRNHEVEPTELSMPSFDVFGWNDAGGDVDEGAWWCRVVVIKRRPVPIHDRSFNASRDGNYWCQRADCWIRSSLECEDAVTVVCDTRESYWSTIAALTMFRNAVTAPGFSVHGQHATDVTGWTDDGYGWVVRVICEGEV